MPRLALVLTAVLVTACGSAPTRTPEPVFASCAEALRAVERGDYRVRDVFPNQRCGEDYTPFSAYARTPAGERCHIGYTCHRYERTDPM